MAWRLADALSFSGHYPSTNAMKSSGKLAASLLRAQQSRLGIVSTIANKASPCSRLLFTETCKTSQQQSDGCSGGFQSRSFAAAASQDSNPKLFDVVKEELDYERSSEGEIKTIPQPPSGWTLSERDGGSTISLARQHNDEQITLTMDIKPMEKEPFPFEKEDLGEEGFDEVAGGSQAEALDQAEEEDDEIDPEVAVAFDVSVEKRGEKIRFEAGFDGEFIELRHVGFGEEKEGLFDGPEYSTLDPGLQQAFVNYLDERGVDLALGEYLMSTHEVKEQKEYVNWLARIEKFLGRN